MGAEVLRRALELAVVVLAIADMNDAGGVASEQCRAGVSLRPPCLSASIAPRYEGANAQRRIICR